MKTKTKNTAIGALLVALTCTIWIAVNRTDESTELDTVYTLSEVTPVADISSATMVNVEALFESYESARLALASDDLAAGTSSGGDLVSVLGLFENSELTSLTEGVGSAQRLHQAVDLASARLAFGEVSESLVATMVDNESLRHGRTLFSCPMVYDGFAKWVQPSSALDNPYMGLSMALCGNTEQWPESFSTEEAEIAYYTCPMHTSVRSEDIGTCPICAMDLVPVSAASLLSGEVVIDGQRRQTFGVRTTAIHRGPMVETLRLPARVEWDPSANHEVNIRSDGWIEGLRVDDVGQSVRLGQTLFTLYSPELISAQGELLAAIGVHGSDHPVAVASRSRLRVLGLADRDIDAIIEAGQTSERVNIRAPQSGVITEINLTEGAHVTAGMSAAVIGQTTTAVVEADLFENHLADVTTGTQATVSFPALHSSQIAAVVESVDPWLNPQTRTARARLIIDNSDGALIAGMDANVSLHIDRGDSLLLPASAVIFNGDNRIVFLDMGEGRLTPTFVTLGARSNELYQVLTGLDSGDEVVTSGTFLVASESRIFSSSATWGINNHE